MSGHVGIGHTRWATHGEPSDRNAHPHKGMTGDVVVVHNGIVENFLELRNDLQAEGAEFASDTDTETIVHLLERYIDAGMTLEEAARATFPQLKGAQAIVAMSRREPDRIIACRIGNAGGVAIGIGDGEMFVASDIPAILEHTRQMVFLESRQMATITADGYYVQTLDGEPVTPEVHTVPWDPVSAAKGEYKHFMQKEIFEQPRAVTDTIRGRVDFEHKCVRLPEMNLTPEIARRIKRINTVACGTSYYSGLVGKMLIERIARIPVDVSIGSEFRYADPLIDESVAVLAITQSGETVDTLAAMEEAREGRAAVDIVNASVARPCASRTAILRCRPGRRSAWHQGFHHFHHRPVSAGVLPASRNGRTERRCSMWRISPAPRPRRPGAGPRRRVPPLALALPYNNFLYLGRGLNYPIAGRCAEAQGDQLHPAEATGGRDEARTHRTIDENMPVLAIATRPRL